MKELESLVRKAPRLEQLSLRKELGRLKRKKQATDEEIESLKNKISKAEERRRRRQRNLPRIASYPDLPIVAKKDEIIRTIRNNQVLILSGATGSGKTTQIPKFCLEAGRGVSGRIGCTQPRRIAATSVASRIAEELGQPLGKDVGFKIRFAENLNNEGYIKVITDGVLLAETQGDPFLNEYDTLIIDEAHERSLNIDFLLGILKSLLHKRRDLKLIITSATIDTQKFSKAFEGAPIIEVSGRTYPVDVKYAPIEEEDNVAEACALKTADILSSTNTGDILIFLPTENDIRETVDNLQGLGLGHTEVLPLYARLSRNEQNKVFKPGDFRRVIVSTNVAETSLTIPRIRYVIDSGLARISQYSPGSRAMSLPITRISRSSADQRKGRAGRVQEGICIRLYSEEDYRNREEFTLPEILRTNLSEVILRMINLRLDDMEKFPFIDRPTDKHLRDGYKLLLELKAIEQIPQKKSGHNQSYRLTTEGKIMARLPLDPRHSRILIQAAKEGCLEDSLVIIGALSIQDPRERPTDKEKEADQAHQQFRSKDSDMLFYLNLWTAIERERSQGKGAVRKFCKRNFISFKRVNEWQDIYRQIKEMLEEEKLPVKNLGDQELLSKSEDFPPGYTRLHRALLSGFLTQVAKQIIMEAPKGRKPNPNMYKTVGSKEAMVFPGSSLFGQGHPWIMSGLMIKTGRLYAREAAKIDPTWLIDLASHLVKYSYSNPHWNKKSGQVQAARKTTYYGFLLQDGEQAPYGPISPEESTNIFIQGALIEEDLFPQQKIKLEFLKYNSELRQSLENIEDKTRRKDLLISDYELLEFYKKKLKTCYDLNSLIQRIREKGQDDLILQEEDLLQKDKPEDLAELFPDRFTSGGSDFVLEYSFNPDSRKDGVTLKVPLAQRDEVSPYEVEYLVPGLLKEKVLALIKGLPKAYRIPLVPVPDKVDHITSLLTDHTTPFLQNLSTIILKEYQHQIPIDEWNQDKLPDHLKMRVSLTDSEGKELKTARNAGVLNEKIATSTDLNKIKKKEEINIIEDWIWEEFPSELKVTLRKKQSITLYPALTKEGSNTAFRLYKDPLLAKELMIGGVENLMLHQLSHQVQALKRSSELSKERHNDAVYFGGRTAIAERYWSSLLTGLWNKQTLTKEDWQRGLETVRDLLPQRTEQAFQILEDSIIQYGVTRRFLAKADSQTKGSFVQERMSDLETLFPKDFPQGYSVDEVFNLGRYARGILKRTERGILDPVKDHNKQLEIDPWIEQLYRFDPNESWSPEKRKLYHEYRWFIEEWKLSLFSPEVKPSMKVSAKRAEERWIRIKSMF
ncbi:ATP-dependent RNA helicase HrpA [Spirochaeta cellobiosiphila]|uniref:ATP-dependent RNA helicase HrpA n=1 Tax=Spirochaeta cellobiosiphila TaxID=504483 RepID=UPI0003FDF696|nr:ATP-dependent RNA helicase HrpA [Spirochaeta cellobiosiphila]